MSIDMYAQSVGQQERYDFLFEKTKGLELPKSVISDYDDLVKEFGLERYINLSLSSQYFSKPSIKLMVDNKLIIKVSGKKNVYEFCY